MKQLLALLFFIPVLSFSQDSLEQELDSISTTEEAKTFAKTYKKANKSKLYTFNKEKHKTRLADDLFKLSKGAKKVVKNIYMLCNTTLNVMADFSTFRCVLLCFDTFSQFLNFSNTLVIRIDAF